MHSVIRPMPNMPNMNMSATAILNSIGGGSLAGMQFQMDTAPPPLMHNSTMGSVSASASGTVPPAPAPAEPVKRKRGRPRKYGPDGTMKAAAAAQQQQHLVSAPPRMGSSMSGPDMLGARGMEDPAQKKRRGRPPGTGKKQQTSPFVGNAFAGSAGTSFTPHIITVSPSEDVAAKIAAFANQSSRAVCVLSATGSVSRVVLRHPGDASPMTRVHSSPPYKNPAIYEGFYEILSLTGSYNLAEGSQQQGQQQSGGLSVTLCSPERNVIGGVLGGQLVAASTVQVVLGSFHQGGSRSKSKKAAAKQAAFSPDGGQEASPSSGHNQQNLTPPSVTGGGGWPTSGIFDTRSSSIDINSSRG
ncbi:AT-hook motif nuclear-localized protein 9-like [Panicum miliaceum]|uniref:AT-hook motif nuclear-localized protein n=1 Tax=Panicum miliaceum TaxID=4540 RepID=A0A3L6PVV6_PANMI|nr:AT-hook motif nuclear-localized protein 9-like [Panicum miliaceum]